MKKIFISIVFVCFAFTIVAQSEGYKPLDNFTKIDVTDKIILQLERSDSNEMKLVVQGMDESNVNVEIVDGTLKLSVNDELISGRVRINVRFKLLEEITGSGVAEISSGNLIKDTPLKVELKSGAKAYLDLDVPSFDAEVIEGSLLQAQGYAVNQNITVKSSATFSGYELEGDVVNVLATFGGKVQ
ncbi:MAG: DUF2807 domain-containing protein [bacterium]